MSLFILGPVFLGGCCPRIGLEIVVSPYIMTVKLYSYGAFASLTRRKHAISLHYNRKLFNKTFIDLNFEVLIFCNNKAL